MVTKRPDGLRNVEATAIKWETLDPDEAREAGLVMAGIAIEKGGDPSCGLLEVLQALSIKEVLTSQEEEQ